MSNNFLRRGRLIAVLLVGLLSTIAGDEAWCDQAYDAGLRYFQKRDWRSSVYYFELALKNAPWDSNAMYYLAMSYHYAGFKSKARAMYKQIVDKFPGTTVQAHARAALKSFGNAPAPTGAGKETDSSTSNSGGSGSGSSSGVNTIGSAKLRSTGVVNIATGDAYIDMNKIPDVTRVYYTPRGDNFLISAQVNGRNTSMLFDTGTQDVVVGKNHLSQLGITAPVGKPTGTVTLSGSAKPVDIWRTTANIKVGDISQRNVPVIIQETLAEPRLGQVFFKHFSYGVDPKSQCLTLSKKGARTSGMRSDSVPFRRDGQHMVVNVSINGKSIPMHFDSSYSGITFSQQQAAAAGLVAGADAEEVITELRGGETKAKAVVVQSIKLGPVHKNNVTVNVVENTAKLQYPQLGQGFCGDWSFTVDESAGAIHFVRR